jgi:hypothetical protein
LTNPTQHVRLHLNNSKNNSNYLTSSDCIRNLIMPPRFSSHTKLYSAKNFCSNFAAATISFVLKTMLAILSVLTMNFSPNRYILHIPRQCTTTVISFLCFEYFCSSSFNFRLSKAIKCPSCTSTPLIDLFQALVCTSNGFSKSSSPKTKADIIVVFNFSKAY